MSGVKGRVRLNEAMWASPYQATAVLETSASCSGGFSASDDIALDGSSSEKDERMEMNRIRVLLQRSA